MSIKIVRKDEYVVEVEIENKEKIIEKIKEMANVNNFTAELILEAYIDSYDAGGFTVTEEELLYSVPIELLKYLDSITIEEFAENDC